MLHQGKHLINCFFFIKGSGVFSPIGSNLSAVTSSQSLHSVAGVTATNNNASDSPRTLGITTATATTPSSRQNVRASSRSLTEFSPSKERAHDGMSKSYSDTKLITNNRPAPDAASSGDLAPGTTRHPSTGEQFLVSSHGITSGDDRQALSGSLPPTEGTRSSQSYVSNISRLPVC